MWFHDAPERCCVTAAARPRRPASTILAGFNDDTRAFLSIRHRHDLARRMDCAYLAELVATQRLERTRPLKVAVDLAYRLPKAAYRL